MLIRKNAATKSLVSSPAQRAALCIVGNFSSAAAVQRESEGNRCDILPVAAILWLPGSLLCYDPVSDVNETHYSGSHDTALDAVSTRRKGDGSPLLSLAETLCFKPPVLFTLVDIPWWKTLWGKFCGGKEKTHKNSKTSEAVTCFSCVSLLCRAAFWQQELSPED